MFIDLVGDYAGKELFLVEGDSLLRECFEDERIDFDCKFETSVTRSWQSNILLLYQNPGTENTSLEMHNTLYVYVYNESPSNIAFAPLTHENTWVTFSEHEC